MLIYLCIIYLKCEGLKCLRSTYVATLCVMWTTFTANVGHFLGQMHRFYFAIASQPASQPNLCYYILTGCLGFDLSDI